MRLLKITLLLLSVLLMIPLAAAQDNTAGGGPGIDITEPISLQAIIDEYGCPVGIRDANRDLLINQDGLISPGQRVLIPRNSPLCDIAYDGEIEFLDWNVSLSQNSYPGTYWELAAYYNVCEDVLWELNPEWNSYYPWSPQARIPVDSPECFETVQLAPGQTPHDLALEYNVCENVIWYYNDVRIYNESSESRPVYLPLDRQPCYLDGQVLVMSIYPHESEAYYVPATIVETDEPTTNIRDFATREGYCDDDIEAANIGKAMMGTPFETVYIPEGARHCSYLKSPEKSLLDISREYNICLETLIDVNDWMNSWTYVGGDMVVAVPTDQPPCYDETGMRIGHHDRVVHETSKDEWLFSIAQEYGVCVADLFAENPLLDAYPRVDLPSIIFIPDRPCTDVGDDGFIHHTVRESDITDYRRDTYGLSLIYNVCQLDIIRANPQIILDRPIHETNANPSNYRLRDLQIGETILIPTGRPCYDFYIAMAGFGFYQGLSQGTSIVIPYICYAETIDPHQDYTGHQPEISPGAEEAGSYCYDRLANPYVVLDNVNYTLYPMYGDLLLSDVAACFGVSAYDIVPITDEQLGLKNGDYPTGVPRFWGIHNATLDCPLIGTEPEAAGTWLRMRYEQSAMGTLNENGEYSVTYGDTLSSIGRRYGYLPDWIRAENNLPDDMIFVRETLRLPGYPNLYQTATYGGAAAGGLILFFGASFVLRLRAKGRKGKKKNDELTA